MFPPTCAFVRATKLRGRQTLELKDAWSRSLEYDFQMAIVGKVGMKTRWWSFFLALRQYFGGKNTFNLTWLSLKLKLLELQIKFSKSEHVKGHSKCSCARPVKIFGSPAPKAAFQDPTGHWSQVALARCLSSDKDIASSSCGQLFQWDGYEIQAQKLFLDESLPFQSQVVVCYMLTSPRSSIYVPALFHCGWHHLHLGIQKYSMVSVSAWQSVSKGFQHCHFAMAAQKENPSKAAAFVIFFLYHIGCFQVPLFEPNPFGYGSPVRHCQAGSTYFQNKKQMILIPPEDYRFCGSYFSKLAKPGCFECSFSTTKAIS